MDKKIIKTFEMIICGNFYLLYKYNIFFLFLQYIYKCSYIPYKFKWDDEGGNIYDSSLYIVKEGKEIYKVNSNLNIQKCFQNIIF